MLRTRLTASTILSVGIAGFVLVAGGSKDAQAYDYSNPQNFTDQTASLKLRVQF